MTISWTLEGELMKLAGADEIASALTILGIIKADEEFVLETVQDWYRSGAETYSLRFSVSNQSCQREFMMKACVAYAGGTPLNDIFASWLSRRSILEDIGVSTPRLHVAGNAVLVEEYIHQSLVDALTSGERREAILRAIGRTAGLLVSAGFVPLSACDWRSHGDDVVLVDFGQDLGPSGVGNGSEAGLLSEVLDNVDQAGIDLTSTELILVSAAYEASLSS
ncbi:MAG: hypothetical protein ACT4NY_22240 [Pseudonocardiales bacterium]